MKVKLNKVFWVGFGLLFLVGCYTDRGGAGILAIMGLALLAIGLFMSSPGAAAAPGAAAPHGSAVKGWLKSAWANHSVVVIGVLAVIALLVYSKIQHGSTGPGFSLLLSAALIAAIIWLCLKTPLLSAIGRFVMFLLYLPGWWILGSMIILAAMGFAVMVLSWKWLIYPIIAFL